VEKGGPDHAIGRSRGGLSTKINALVDQDGLPLRIVLSAGQALDKAAVEALIDGLKPAKALVADRGHEAQAIIDPAIYRHRNVVERYFCKLNHF